MAYREAFYGKQPSMLVENNGAYKTVYLDNEAKEKWQEYTRLQFDYAWLHHQHKNPHHWQHWVLRRDNGRATAMDMPEKFIREMVADWVGAGYAIKGRVEVQTWYRNNKQHMDLSPKTQALVEQLLLIFPDGAEL